MAELQIRLDIDPVSGKKNVTIEYKSDDDALPMEHEEAHRRLVDALIEGGALKAAELGKIRVERDGEVVVEQEAAQPAAAREGLSEDG